MTYRQKKLIAIAIIVFIVVFSTAEIIKVFGASKFYYNKNFLPPRIHQLCNDNFIGIDWDISKKYEKRCRGLWTSWSNEIKTTLQY